MYVLFAPAAGFACFAASVCVCVCFCATAATLSFRITQASTSSKLLGFFLPREGEAITATIQTPPQASVPGRDPECVSSSGFRLSQVHFSRFSCPLLSKAAASARSGCLPPRSSHFMQLPRSDWQIPSPVSPLSNPTNDQRLKKKNSKCPP